jgi:hypothetical protein
MRTIAFVSSSISYTNNIQPIAQRLSRTGYEVFWITHRETERRFLLREGVPDRNIFAAHNEIFEVSATQLQYEFLASLEEIGDLRINNIILMDRLLRRKPTRLAYNYLARSATGIAEFVAKNNIRLVSRGRDSALQIIAMLVCQRAGILSVSPSMVRLPPGLFAWAPFEDDSGYLEMRRPTEVDALAAHDFLRKFLASTMRAQAWTAAGSLKAIIQRLPEHLRIIAQESRYAWFDKGNDYSRYTVGDLLRSYMRKRWNLARYKLAKLNTRPGVRPYVVYPLHMQPESTIDVFGPFHSDQLNLITQITRALPCTHDLYVKIHPSDIDGWSSGFYGQISRLPNTRLIGPEYSSRDLIRSASLVITVAGSMAYEAGLCQIPAVTFSRNFFCELPTVYFCDSPSSLPGLIQKLLRIRGDNDYTAEITEFLTRLIACSFSGQIDGFTRAFSQDETDAYVSAVNTLYEGYVEGDKKVPPRVSPETWLHALPASNVVGTS